MAFKSSRVSVAAASSELTDPIVHAQEQLACHYSPNKRDDVYFCAFQ
jgi:hypothetical protein